MANEADRRNAVSPTADPTRNAVRFPLQIPVRVDAEGQVIQAVTQDVSASGVLFVMPVAPAVHTRLTWTLILPAEVMGAPSDTVVHCVGRVVWTSPGIAGRQVGVMIDSYRIGEKVA